MAIGDHLVAAWSVGGRLLCFMDVVSLEWTSTSVALPFDLDVVLFSGKNWLMQPERSSDVFVFDRSDSSLLRRFATSEVVPLIAGHGSSLYSACDLVLLPVEGGWERWPLTEREGRKVLRAIKLEGAPYSVVQTDTAMLLVDTERKAVRPVCGDDAEEDSSDPVVTFCELTEGQLFVVRASGVAKIYDCNSEKLAEEEKMWRVMVGLGDDDGTNDESEDKPAEVGLTLKVGDVAVDSGARDEEVGQGQNGSGGGAGGGRGPGSGGEGEGSGGTSGIRRQVLFFFAVVCGFL